MVLVPSVASYDVFIATAVDDDNSVVREVFTKTCRLKSTSSIYNTSTSDDDDDDYYYYYHHRNRIPHFSALAGKYSPILGFSNQQD
jgi:hypothetical protein